MPAIFSLRTRAGRALPTVWKACQTFLSVLWTHAAWDFCAYASSSSGSWEIALLAWPHPSAPPPTFHLSRRRGASVLGQKNPLSLALRRWVCLSYALEEVGGTGRSCPGSSPHGASLRMAQRPCPPQPEPRGPSYPATSPGRLKRSHTDCNHILSRRRPTFGFNIHKLKFCLLFFLFRFCFLLSIGQFLKLLEKWGKYFSFVYVYGKISQI